MTRPLHRRINRRAFLRGSGGALISLPLAHFSWRGSQLVAEAASEESRRLVTWSFPNGCSPDLWTPELALLPLKENVNALHASQIFNNVQNPAAEATPGDPHEIGGMTLFVGARPTEPSRISIDQIVSDAYNKNTSYGRSLVVGAFRGSAGGMDRAATWFQRSWRQGIGVTGQFNPAQVFRDLFGAGLNPAAQAVTELKHSVLDDVLESYKSQLGDRSQLTEHGKAMLSLHLEELRDMELRAKKFGGAVVKDALARQGEFTEIGPDGLGRLVYAQFVPALDQLIELVVLAFKCGATNAASMVFGSGGEEFQLPNAPFADHHVSHYENAFPADKVESARNLFVSYRRFHVGNAMKLMAKLAQTPDGDGGMLLQNTVILVATEFGNSPNHVKSPQPHLILGGGNFLKLGGATFTEACTNTEIYSTVLKALGIDKQAGETQYNARILPILK